MVPTDPVRQLLTEIRDAQRESLAEYRRVTARSLELQEQSVVRQAEIAALYKKAVIAGAAVIAPLIVLLVYLITLLP